MTHSDSPPTVISDRRVSVEVMRWRIINGIRDRDSAKNRIWISQRGGLVSIGKQGESLDQ